MQRGARSFIDLLVGIEVGVLGGSIALVWFALVSPVAGQPWWIIPNLFASALYSEYHVRAGASVVTCVGVALHLVTSGIVGAINALVTPGGRLFSLGVALVWYVFCYLWLWKRIAPLLPLYGSQPVIIAGWFIFGSVLGWHPWFRARAAPPQAAAQRMSVTASESGSFTEHCTEEDNH
jgi:hypothetical protein